jgi:hypothetical protein
MQEQPVFVEIARRVLVHKELYFRRVLESLGEDGREQVSKTLLPKVKELLTRDTEFEAATLMPGGRGMLQDTSYYIMNQLCIVAFKDKIVGGKANKPYFQSQALSSVPKREGLSLKSGQ